MPKEANIKDVLEAINNFSSDVDRQFSDVNNQFSEINKRFTKIESLMVTKDYLDEKIADLRGDLVVLVRKEDSKLKKLVDVLTKKKIISKDDAKQINSMEPVAQISL